jgi:hypothetical protein
MFRKYKTLSWLLRDLELDDSNLHRIAISNLEDSEVRVRRWWTKKYKRPTREFDEHTREELVIEMLEDFYEANTSEIDRFFHAEDAKQARLIEWDGSMPEAHEKAMRARFKKVNEKVDLKRYQTSEQLTAEQEKAILDNLGKGLPGSRALTNKGKEVVLGKGDEFDENF